MHFVNTDSNMNTHLQSNILAYLPLLHIILSHIPVYCVTQQPYSHTHKRTHTHPPPNWCSMSSRSNCVKDPFETPAVVDWTRLSISLHTHTRAAFVEQGQGQMPHPGLGDWHLVCKISYRVNQTSQGCHPLTRCFVGVHKQSVGHIDTVNTPTSVCFRISFWLALSARRPPELMLHSTLGSPDEIKQSHF